MSDVIGRGVIELSADSSGLNAAIDKARKSISGLGEASAKSSASSSKSIDNYIQKLERQRAQLGMTTRETELYKLALRGASNEQLRAANTSLKLTEAYKRGEMIGDKIGAGFRSLGLVAATGLIAAAAAFDGLIKKAADFQDISEKTGDTAENIASLAVAAATGGKSMEEITAFSIRLTKSLTGVDDESKAAGSAIKALGLDLESFKKLKAADQMEALGKALNSFADGSEKTAVMEALGKGAAQLLPFLKELGQEGGRQVILTQKQIELADEYADKQAKLHATISLHAQAIATDMVPALNAFKQAIADLVKDQEHSATASDLLNGALAAGIVVFQTIAVVASDVGFVFKGVGREIGAIAAQMVALAHLDFAGFRAISDAVKADGVRARAELDKFQAKIMSIGKPKEAEDTSNYSNEGRGKEKRPTLKFNGAVNAGPKGRDTAGQEAKAQLAYDLEQIKKATAAELNIYSNAEKIMEAKRAARLIEDKEYYTEKLAFIQLNSQAAEAESIKEIERLQAEKLAGKDKIDNDRKILDAQAKLAKIRADAAANVSVLGIQEAAAAQKIVQAYTDAKNAAQAYLDTVKNQNAREIEGIGRGTKFRDEQAGRNQIEDKFTGQRQGLERDLRRDQITREEYDTYLAIARQTYAEEVRLYEARTAAMDAAQADWSNGAREALQNYADESRNFAKQTEYAFRNAFEGLEDALVQFTQTGKLDFKSLISSINADIARIAIKGGITGPLSEWVKGAIGGKDAAKIGQGGGLIEQSAAANASTIALNALAAAANSSAAALAGGRPLDITPGSKQIIPSMGDFTRADRVANDPDGAKQVADAQRESADSAGDFSKAALATATDLSKLAQATGSAGGALALLPNILRLASASTATSGGSSGGGMWGSLISAAASYFGGTGDLQVETVASGAVSANYNEKPNFLRGGRALGGPVSAGGLYEVNEKGRPELLNVAGRQYLMMGNQGGSVDANPSQGGGGSVTNLHVNVTPPPGSNAATAAQWGSTAGRQIQRSLARNG
jgi:lambda family phage tail tape measure protein